MGELKFRLWDKWQLKFVEYNPFKILNIDKDRYEINQYSGFNDKDNKNIYAGDIVNIENGKYPVIAQCKYDNGFILEDIAYGHWTRQLYHQPERLTIIGNIYENPELI